MINSAIPADLPKKKKNQKDFFFSYDICKQRKEFNQGSGFEKKLICLCEGYIPCFMDLNTHPPVLLDCWMVPILKFRSTCTFANISVNIPLTHCPTKGTFTECWLRIVNIRYRKVPMEKENQKAFFFEMMFRKKIIFYQRSGFANTHLFK